MRGEGTKRRKVESSVVEVYMGQFGLERNDADVRLDGSRGMVDDINSVCYHTNLVGVPG